MGKTASEKRSARQKPQIAANGVDASTPDEAAAQASPAGDPAEPIERARLQAEVARQRVRIAKEELKRARRRVKEAKREAKRARKQAAVARKAWKKARKAHRAKGAPRDSAGKGKRLPQALKGPARAGKRKSTRRRTTVPARKSQAPETEVQSQPDGSAPATPSTET